MSRPMIGLLSNRHPQGKFFRWFWTMQEITPAFNYVEGKTNVTADTVFRYVAVVSEGPSLDLDEVIREQQRNDVCRPITHFIKEELNDLPSNPQFQLRNFSCMMMYLAEALNWELQLDQYSRLFPKSLVPTLLVFLHAVPWAGHLSKDKCIIQIQLFLTKDD